MAVTVVATTVFPIRLLPVMLPTVDIKTSAVTVLALRLLVRMFPPVINPVAEINPDVSMLPPVMLAVVVTGPVRLTKLPVYVGKKAATLALL